MVGSSFTDAQQRIKKELLTTGRMGRKPTLNSKCVVELDSECDVLDFSSEYFKHSNERIVIGYADHELDVHIEECIQSMDLGERSTFYISLNNNDVTVTIVLKSCEDNEYIFHWTDGQKKELAETYKSQGITLFGEKRFQHAFTKFSKALKLLLLLREPTTDETTNHLMINLYNNLAKCHLMKKNFDHALTLCSKSLQISPNSKAYYRMALAYTDIKEYEKAETNLVDLLKIEPENVTAQKLLKSVRTLDSNNRANYQNIIKKMFQ